MDNNNGTIVNIKTFDKILNFSRFLKFLNLIYIPINKDKIF